MPAMHDQQQIDYWSVARMSKLPGAQITTTIDSSQWTTRTKNAVKRMLMQGQIVGGWSSVTAKLAEAIAKDFGVRCVKVNSTHIKIISPSAEVRAQLVPIIKADYTAYRMGEDFNMYSHDWMIERVTTAERELARSIAEFSYYFHERAFADQARELVATLNPPENVERAKQACMAIDQGATFTYNTVQ